MADMQLVTAEQREGALWIALRSLEEKVGLRRRMAISAGDRGSAPTAERYVEPGAETARASDLVRGLIAEITSMNGVGDEGVRP